MSSRVGTAIPARRSTALSSAAVGFSRSIQTALSGRAARSAAASFFSEVAEGMKTDSMEDLGDCGRQPGQWGFGPIPANARADGLIFRFRLWRLDGRRMAPI